MAPARKTPAKKAAARGGRPQAVKPVGVKPSRFAAFDSASDEWAGEPIAFVIDGTTWLCTGAPSSKVVKWLRDPGTVSTSEFVAACVLDRDAWETWLDANPVPVALLSGVAQFLMRAYLGIEPGK